MIFSGTATGKPLKICAECNFCRCDGIGRRSGLKIHRWRQRTGSSPVTGTKSEICCISTDFGFSFFQQQLSVRCDKVAFLSTFLPITLFHPLFYRFFPELTAHISQGLTLLLIDNMGVHCCSTQLQMPQDLLNRQQIGTISIQD